MRTKDSKFYKCPVCGRSPVIDRYDLNYGGAYCKGIIGNRHRIIEANVGYCVPYYFKITLAEAWNNKVVEYELRQ